MIKLFLNLRGVTSSEIELNVFKIFVAVFRRHKANQQREQNT